MTNKGKATKGRVPVKQAAETAFRDQDDNQMSFGGWLLPVRAHGSVRLLLVSRDSSFRQLFMEALMQRGHQVTAAGETAEAVQSCRHERFDVALLLTQAQGTPVLMQHLRELDVDLEVVWMPPPISVAQAEALVQDAADRARRRLQGLYQAARGLLEPLPPDETANRLLEKAEDILSGSAMLSPHKSQEPAEVLLSPDRRRVRVPLWNGGPAPDEGDEGGSGEEDSGHRLEVCRDAVEPELSQADLLRAAVLGSLGSLALTRAHCEQALAEMYRELEQAKTQAVKRVQGDPMQGRGLTSGAIGPLERLAGVLAHELNNPLTFVLANLACLQEEFSTLRETLEKVPAASHVLPQIDEIDEVLSEAMGGAGRVREVVADLTTLGARGDGDGDQHPVMIDEVVRASLRIARREVQRRAQVLVDVEPHLPAVRGSASRLGQVILNLLLNAVQAVPHGEAEAHEVRIWAREQAEYVLISISDTGSGITPDTLPRVFDPGYTTKPLGEGSGLGLAISREIARAHGGEIQIESKPGRGTTVTVLLPVARGVAGYTGAAEGPTERKS